MITIEPSVLRLKIGKDAVYLLCTWLSIQLQNK